jgi:UDP-N-acetylglucosamine 2-epimerase (non-hydrolysing)
MAPLAAVLASDARFNAQICVTGQHREMLDQVIGLFGMKPKYDLNIMKSGQNLADITAAVLTGCYHVIEDFKPDLILVHGDTSTTLAATIAAYYSRTFVAHVEAGLRTGNIYSPWPEEGNRRGVGALANLHFAPTENARGNLRNESVPDANIHVVGNTVIDALLEITKKIDSSEKIRAELEIEFSYLHHYDNFILVTGHRRESFGDGFDQICAAIRELAEIYPTMAIVYPVHLNPNVQEPVKRLLGGIDNVYLIEPLDYLPFIYLMARCAIILTDSGGIQEEAPSLGKPVLVMRDTTERPEAVAAGTVILVGTKRDKIVYEASRIINDKAAYQAMSLAHNPYGDGKAALRIKDVILKEMFRE